jgi:hypothetical protein
MEYKIRNLIEDINEEKLIFEENQINYEKNILMNIYGD